MTNFIKYYSSNFLYKIFYVCFLLQLDIQTVAAGGGSMLFFRSGLLVVGPESAGAHPGPVCYRKGIFLCNSILLKMLL